MGLITKTYDLGAVVCTLGPVGIGGYGEEGGLEFEQASVIGEVTVGATGLSTFSRSNNKDMIVTITVMETSLAYNLLGAITDVPILLSPGGKSVISDEDLELELNIVAPTNLQNILDLMASSSENLDWTIRNGVVVITEVEANAKNKRKNTKRDK